MNLTVIFSGLIVMLLSSCSGWFEDPNSKIDSTKYFIHEEHRNTIGEIQTQLKNNRDGVLVPKVKAYKDSINFQLDYEVFGWFPSWEERKYKNINYSLLSTLAYFSYEVNPSTGNEKTIHDWNTTPMIDSAKANNVDILLTITNFGSSNNRKLLKNSDSRTTLINRVVTLIQFRDAQGVSVDFEGVSKNEKSELTSFIADLKAGLNKAEKDSEVPRKYKLYLSLPAVDGNDVFDIEELEPNVDTFVIMGYDYYGSFSHNAGPVSPLESADLWEKDNLERSVMYYKKQGLKGSDLLLALPFYGAAYETETADKNAKVVKFIGSKSLDEISTLVDSSKTKFDTISSTAWYPETDKDNAKKYTQYWFDNEVALNGKLEFIKGDTLKGMGIWALGYDAGNHKLWKVIEENFTQDKNDSVKVKKAPPATPSEAGKNGPSDTPGEAGKNGLPDTVKDATQKKKKVPLMEEIEGILKKLYSYKTALATIMAMIVLFGGAGLVIGMFKPDTRSYFFDKAAYRIYYSAFILLFVLILSRWKWPNFMDNYTVTLIVGFIIGGITIYFVNRLVENIIRNRP